MVESQPVANISQISVTPDRQRSITVDRDIDNGQLMSPVPTDRSLCQTDSVGEIEIQARATLPGHQQATLPGSQQAIVSK